MTIDEPDEIVGVLQDLVLPAGTPVLRDLDLAAHYSVAAEPGESAGAWFDVVPLDAGRTALVVGQAPGSGVGAAVAASGVAAVIRAGLLCHQDAVAAVELADLYAARTPDVRGTTAGIAVLDPRQGRFTDVTAAPEGPVVVRHDGSAVVVGKGGAPLGTGGGHRPVAHDLAVGDLVVLSGTTELSVGNLSRPATSELVGESLRDGALATVAEVARRGAAWQARGAAVHVVAVRREPVVADLEVRLDVDATTSRRARLELGAWLDALGAPEMGALSLVHATAELVTNVVDHAYEDGAPGGSGIGVVLRASHAEDGVVRVEVLDAGRWLVAPADSARGRGLAMAAGLVDELSVATDEHGTCVSLAHRLSRPFHTERPHPELHDDPSHPLRISHPERGRVVFTGVLGSDDADEVGAALMLASRGGTVAVEVDLTGVAHLSSGGVRVLEEAVRQVPATSDPAAVVVLQARRGSVPQVELERAGIAHHAS